MLCLSGLLVCPFLVADVACAGSASTELRVQLIAATFVTAGLATLIQVFPDLYAITYITDHFWAPSFYPSWPFFCFPSPSPCL